MKNILLIFACALFASTSVFAQLTENPGAVTVDVVKHLSITVVETDVMFTYNEHGFQPSTDIQDDNFVTIKANVDWIMEVSAVGGATVLTNTAKNTTIPADLLTYYLYNPEGIVNSAGPSYPFSPTAANSPYGSLNATFTMYWDWDSEGLDPSNLYAGKYQIGVLYTLVEPISPTPPI